MAEASQKVLLCGEVQSGKTKYIIDYIRNSKLPCVLVLRNSIADLNQFTERVIESNKFTKGVQSKIKNSFGVHSPSDSKIKVLQNVPKEDKNFKNDCVLVLINNVHRIRRAMDITIPFNLILDEADLLLKHPYNKDLATRAKGCLFVTATYKSLLNNGYKCYKLPLPDNYYGINRTEFVKTESLSHFMIKMSRRESYTTLVTISKFNYINIKFMKYSFEELSDDKVIMLAITYKGTYIKTARSLRKLRKACNLPISKTKQDVYFTPCKTVSKLISSFQNEPRLMIFAGLMASRGVSFVSEDYNRHLTDQYMGIRSTKVDNLVQYMRIFGLYKDSPELKLYSDVETYRKIFKYIRSSSDLVQNSLNRLEWGNSD